MNYSRPFVDTICSLLFSSVLSIVLFSFKSSNPDVSLCSLWFAFALFACFASLREKSLLFVFIRVHSWITFCVFLCFRGIKEI